MERSKEDERKPYPGGQLNECCEGKAKLRAIRCRMDRINKRSKAAWLIL